MYSQREAIWNAVGSETIPSMRLLLKVEKAANFIQIDWSSRKQNYSELFRCFISPRRTERKGTHCQKYEDNRP